MMRVRLQMMRVLHEQKIQIHTIHVLFCFFFLFVVFFYRPIYIFFLLLLFCVLLILFQCYCFSILFIFIMFCMILLSYLHCHDCLFPPNILSLAACLWAETLRRDYRWAETSRRDCILVLYGFTFWIYAFLFVCLFFFFFSNTCTSAIPRSQHPLAYPFFVFFILKWRPLSNKIRFTQFTKHHHKHNTWTDMLRS